MIVNRELTISNRKKADIVMELRKLDFRPFSKVKQAKRAGEKEPVLEDLEAAAAAEEDEAETGASCDYDYLLGMSIRTLTKEKVRTPDTLYTMYHIVRFFRSPSSSDKFRRRKMSSENCFQRIPWRCGRQILMLS